MIPTSAAVVVIGGGFAGAATACWLTRAGVRDVVLLERERSVGQHASGRNAALCRQLAEDEAVTDLTVRGARFLHDPPAELAPGPLVSRSGSLLVAGDGALLERQRARAAARGLAHELIGPAELVARWPLLAGAPAAGGLHFRDDGVIDIEGLLRGFLSMARAGGARVELGCYVTGFRPAEAGVVVTTSRGDIAARCAVVAAGAWAGELGARAGAPVDLTAIRRHLFLSEPTAALAPGAPWMWRLDDELYARPEAGACLLSGCDGEALPAGSTAVAPGAADALADKLRRSAPALAELAIARTWACQRTFTPDHRPLCGWDERQPWLFWVAGLGGHGATASAPIGQDAAAAIARRLI